MIAGIPAWAEGMLRNASRDVGRLPSLLNRLSGKHPPPLITDLHCDRALRSR
jgi:hypothetical protein